MGGRRREHPRPADHRIHQQNRSLWRAVVVMVWLGLLLCAAWAADLVARCYDGIRQPPTLNSHRLYRGIHGRLWLDFMSGADAYDGQTVTSYVEAIGGQGRFLYAFHQDSDGRKWLGHEGGLTVMDANNRVERHYGPADGLSPHAVTAIVRAGDRTLLALTSGGVYRLTGGMFLREPLPAPSEGGILADLAVQRDGTAVARLNGDLYRRNPEGGWAPVSLQPAFAGETLQNLRASPDGVLTLTYRSGAVRLQPDFSTDIALPFPDEIRRQPFAAATFMGRDTLLVLATSAFHVLSEGRWHRLRHPTGDVFDYRNRILVDYEGIIWVPHRDGILKLTRLDLERLGVEDGLPGLTLRAVATDPAGGILALTSTGAAYQPPGAARFQPLPAADPAAGGEFEAVAPGRGGTLLLVARHRIVRWSPSKGGQELPVPAAATGRWCDAAETADGALWIASREGLHRSDSSGVRHIDTRNGLPHNACLSLDAAPDGTIWVATLGGGLARVRGDSVTALTTRDGLATNRLVDVAVAPDGTVWACGFGGASRITQEGIVSFGPSDLPSLDRAVCIHPIGTKAYVFTDGLAEVDSADHSSRQLFSSDDPAVWTCSASFHSSLTVARGGEVLLGSDVNGGLLRWHARAFPDGGRYRDRRCRLRIFERDGTLLDISRSPVTLSSDWSRLRFGFTTSSLWREDATTFIYHLEGYDADWSSPSARSWVEYTQIGSGDRRFAVRARYEDGTWSDLATLDFRVPSSWWNAPPAVAGFIAGLALVLWGLVWLRTRTLRERQQRLERLVADRTRELESLNTRLQRLSTTDQLTGLANRRSFAESIDTLAALVLRSTHPDTKTLPQERMALLFAMVDLDHFKEVNDHYGHTQGDLVLQWTANKLCATLRESDLIIRWGGDEFLVVAYQRQMEPVTVLPERILAAIRQQEDAGALPFRYPTCSLGFTRFPLGSGPDRDVWLDALKLADAALLMAKQRGRNRAVGVTERGRFSATELDSIAGLETAAAAGEIEIVHII